MTGWLNLFYLSQNLQRNSLNNSLESSKIIFNQIETSSRFSNHHPYFDVYLSLPEYERSESKMADKFVSPSHLNEVVRHDLKPKIYVEKLRVGNCGRIERIWPMFSFSSRKKFFKSVTHS
jgi:hypothetical protein